MVIWFIGLSGSGKTTIGRELTNEMKRIGRPAIFIDGDIFRSIMGNDVGHTIEDRKLNADRICRFCKYFDEQGIDVVFAVLSIFHESQDWNRENIDQYYEIFIDVSIETVIRRDPKGLYKRAQSQENSNVVGLDIEFHPPKKPSLVLKNDDDTDDLKPIVHKIIDGLRSKGLLS